MDSLDQKLNCLAYLFQYLNKELLLLMSNLIYSILELLFSHDNPPFYNFLFLILIIYYLRQITAADEVRYETDADLDAMVREYMKTPEDSITSK